mgnify:FL=1|jgi:hypothetical protein
MVLDSYQDMQDIVKYGAIGQNVLIKTVFNPDK